MRQILIDGLVELGIGLTEKQRHQLDVYQNEIMLWNGKYGLLASSVTQEELDVKHFLDSLSAYSVLKNMQFNTACDVGSGGGFPGLVLAILFPDKKFTLIERSGKKAMFLTNTSVMMGASNVEVLNQDAAEIAARYDMVFFRALGQFVEYFPSLYRLAGSGGCLFAFKGRKSEIKKEISALDKAIRDRVEIIETHVPFLKDERNFVIIGK